jgi:hypothetical protein
MKRLFLAAALALTACNPAMITSNGTLPAPAQIASHTLADEAVMKGAEGTYAMLRNGIEALTDAGVLKGARAVTAAKIDNDAYAALGLIRKAYEAFNSTALATAARNLADLAKQGAALIKGAKP